MSLAPLTLSVCENGAVGGVRRGSCPFCGVRLEEDREPFLCVDGSKESSCVPCSLVRHLERETIAEEAVLIWLPDLSQAALNALANGVHRRLAENVRRGRPETRLGLRPPHLDRPNRLKRWVRGLA